MPTRPVANEQTTAARAINTNAAPWRAVKSAGWMVAAAQAESPAPNASNTHPPTPEGKIATAATPRPGAKTLSSRELCDEFVGVIPRQPAKAAKPRQLMGKNIRRGAQFHVDAKLAE